MNSISDCNFYRIHDCLPRMVAFFAIVIILFLSGAPSLYAVSPAKTGGAGLPAGIVAPGAGGAVGGAAGAGGDKGIKALEAADCGLLGIKCPAEASGRTVVEVILLILNFVLLLVGVIALAVIIWAGVTYIISLGDESKVGKAKKTLLYAIVGLLVIGIAGIVVNVVINLF